MTCECHPAPDARPEPILFIATPTYAGSFEHEFVTGLITGVVWFGSRIIFSAYMSSLLPRARDLLISKFLDSQATHYLSIDSDIGWSPEDVQRLLDADKDLISGCYSRKDEKQQTIVQLAEGETWATDRLLRAKAVPGGFFLMKRAAVERLVTAYAQAAYTIETGETAVALHNPIVEDGKYIGEDYSFCRRWREIGGELWIHPGVVLNHVGRYAFRPDHG